MTEPNTGELMALLHPLPEMGAKYTTTTTPSKPLVHSIITP
jgi:hypothetical protein